MPAAVRPVLTKNTRSRAAAADTSQDQLRAAENAKKEAERPLWMDREASLAGQHAERNPTGKDDRVPLAGQRDGSHRDMSGLVRSSGRLRPAPCQCHAS